MPNPLAEAAKSDCLGMLAVLYCDPEQKLANVLEVYCIMSTLPRCQANRWQVYTLSVWEFFAQSVRETLLSRASLRAHTRLGSIRAFYPLPT